MLCSACCGRQELHTSAIHAVLLALTTEADEQLDWLGQLAAYVDAVRYIGAFSGTQIPLIQLVQLHML
jgi:hypothetical protein